MTQWKFENVLLNILAWPGRTKIVSHIKSGAEAKYYYLTISGVLAKIQKADLEPFPRNKNMLSQRKVFAKFGEIREAVAIKPACRLRIPALKKGGYSNKWKGGQSEFWCFCSFLNLIPEQFVCNLNAVEMLAHKKYELWRVSVITAQWTKSAGGSFKTWASGITPLDRVGRNPAPVVLLMDQH